MLYSWEDNRCQTKKYLVGKKIIFAKSGMCLLLLSNNVKVVCIQKEEIDAK